MLEHSDSVVYENPARRSSRPISVEVTFRLKVSAVVETIKTLILARSENLTR